MKKFDEPNNPDSELPLPSCNVSFSSVQAQSNCVMVFSSERLSSLNDQNKHVKELQTQDLALASLKIEDIYEELGGFSWFQLIMTVLLILPEIPAGMIAVSPVFIGAVNVPFHCITPNGWNETFTDLDEGAHIYSGTNPILCSHNCSRVIPASVHQSIVQEWNLLCDSAWMTDSFTSIQMLGMTSGSFLGSFMADKFGRKKSFFLMNSMMALFGTCSGLVTSVYFYGVLRYFAGVGMGGFYVVYSIYLIEFLTPSWRTICGCISIWFIGEMLLALAAYFISSWRTLVFVTSLPASFIFVFLMFLPESPRFLLCQGRTKEAKAVFNQISFWNSRPVLSTERMVKLQECIMAERNTSSKKESSSGLGKLLSKELALQFCLFAYGWFAIAFIYYGITFNTKNLSGDPYMNVLYMAIVDMPAFPSGVLFNNWLGRKRTFSFALLFGTTFLVALVVVQEMYGIEQHPNVITVLCYLGRFGIAAAWGVIYCFTAESFPTVVRSTSLGFCSLVANIGGILAPLVAYAGIVSPTLPYCIFCGVAITAASTSYFLTETKGKPLKNFVQ